MAWYQAVPMLWATLADKCLLLNGIGVCRHEGTASPKKPAIALKIPEVLEDEPDLMMFTPAAADIEADGDAVSSKSLTVGQEVSTCRKSDGRQLWWTRRLWMR